METGLASDTTDGIPIIASIIILGVKIIIDTEIESICTEDICNCARPIVAATAHVTRVASPIPTIHKIGRGILDITTGAGSEPLHIH